MRGYPFPPDEFDDAESSPGPRGAHRAPRSLWSRWWPFAVTIVLFPALAYALVTNLSDWTSGLGPIDAIFEDGPAEPGTDRPPATDPDATDPDVADPGTTDPEPDPEPEPEPEPEPVVDLARPVEVLNATGTAGLAARAADVLTGEGFTDVVADNYPGAAGASAVFYGVEDDAATAQQVGAALGITQVTLAPDRAPAGIVAVLAGDFADPAG